jgi:nicotinamidase-related amidase
VTKRVWDAYITERDREVYRLGGFAKRGHLTPKLAVLVIDTVYHSVGDKPEPILESAKRFPASCGDAGWDAIGRIKSLLTSARAAGVPIVYVIPQDPTDVQQYGRYLDKMPAVSQNQRIAGHRSKDIVEDIAAQAGDTVVRKPKSSGFFKTGLAETLAGMNVDSVLITGCTTSGCIRLTAADAFQHDLHAAVVEECVYDRGQASHAVNLFDIDAKYADVIALDEALAYVDQAGLAATAAAASRNREGAAH